ncbi:MAG: hypothetical protein HOU81_26200 [Hamadaea sp.]|uniref:hypothetical protein n=1 Tax=Hamadaea sp. TaxID=2024425 RepID=UPI00182C3079|nr:hypothetical protein [Hamadaea sp.]NUR74317.1 hypothetical protein [Hamadaea sp.]NUT22315.1 hypothetical protein [Hamadaea sp.]
MRPGERRLRRHAILLFLTGPITAGLLALAGCGGTTPPIDRTDLVNDLAARLNQPPAADYTARYQLAGGTIATVTQSKEPRRTAYRWTDGALILTPQATTRCSGAPAVCTMTAAPASATPQPDASELLKHGLVPAQKVSALLTAAALDLRSEIEQRDTTIAGRPASCVEVSGERNGKNYDIEACVTTDNVLGSFTGMVDGAPIEFAMTQYSPNAAPDAFATSEPSPSISAL